MNPAEALAEILDQPTVGRMVLKLRAWELPVQALILAHFDTVSPEGSATLRAAVEKERAGRVTPCSCGRPATRVETFGPDQYGRTATLPQCDRCTELLASLTEDDIPQ